MAIVTGRSLVQKFIDAGFGLPDICTRIVIDIPSDGIARLYYETHIDGDKIDKLLSAGLNLPTAERMYPPEMKPSESILDKACMGCGVLHGDRVDGIADGFRWICSSCCSKIERKEPDATCKPEL